MVHLVAPICRPPVAGPPPPILRHRSTYLTPSIILLPPPAAQLLVSPYLIPKPATRETQEGLSLFLSLIKSRSRSSHQIYKKKQDQSFLKFSSSISHKVNSLSLLSVRPAYNVSRIVNGVCLQTSRPWEQGSSSPQQAGMNRPLSRSCCWRHVRPL